jgi:D-glycero-alpha-D-manno-heptose 1-phosphate guanylyltransferase
MNNLTCIILAGGLGTRLKSEIFDLPKCLAPINGVPFIDWQLKAFSRYQLGRFILALGFGANDVIKHFNGKRIVQQNLKFSIENKPLGTGGAVFNAMEKYSIDEAVIINGDSIVFGDISGIFNHLKREDGELCRVGLILSSDRSRYGGVTVAGDRVVEFSEKSDSSHGLINSGIYLLRREVFDGFNIGDAISLEKQILPSLVERRALTYKLLDGNFIDIGVPTDYRRATDIFRCFEER